jgi:hypothetical protein
MTQHVRQLREDDYQHLVVTLQLVHRGVTARRRGALRAPRRDAQGPAQADKELCACRRLKRGQHRLPQRLSRARCLRHALGALHEITITHWFTRPAGSAWTRAFLEFTRKLVQCRGGAPRISRPSAQIPILTNELRVAHSDFRRTRACDDEFRDVAMLPIARHYVIDDLFFLNNPADLLRAFHEPAAQPEEIAVDIAQRRTVAYPLDLKHQRLDGVRGLELPTEGSPFVQERRVHIHMKSNPIICERPTSALRHASKFVEVHGVNLVINRLSVETPASTGPLRP